MTGPPGAARHLGIQPPKQPGQPLGSPQVIVPTPRRGIRSALRPSVASPFTCSSRLAGWWQQHKHLRLYGLICASTRSARQGWSSLPGRPGSARPGITNPDAFTSLAGLSCPVGSWRHQRAWPEHGSGASALESPRGGKQ